MEKKGLNLMDVDTQFEGDLSPRERRHARTQQAILDAARVIIHEQGPDKLSMRAIADRIDYSPAGLYEYYGSKEEIISAVCQQGHLRLKADLAAVDASLPASAYLVELGMAYIRFAVRHPDYFLLMFTHPVAGRDVPDSPARFPSAQMMSDWSSFPILMQGVERGLAEGSIQGAPGYGLPEIAYSLWAFVHGIAMLRITNLRDYDVPFDEIDRKALERFNRGLGL